MVAAGGEVWFGDETTLREFPPLRASWARRGEQRVVVISGRNARRVVHGALDVATGELVTLIRERSRQDDCVAFVEALGQIRPAVPKLLVWDNAPPHHPKKVLAAAAAAHIAIAFLPFRAPELMPCEDLWRLAKGLIAANRAYEAVQEQAERARAWLDALSPYERLLKTGLFGPKFQWLST
jgi:transposase